MIFHQLNVTNPSSQPYVKASVYLYEAHASLHTNVRPMILVCPGGGYTMTSDREADMVAMQFNAMGYHSAVLHYSVAPARFPTALLEVASFVRQLRENSKEWNIDPDRIAVVGFSAGGHLACSYCCLWNEPWVAQALGCDSELLRPNGMILGYPVITSGEFAHHGSFHNLLGEEYEAKKEALSLENRITDAVPTAFIWHTWEDGSVPVQNSLMLVSQLTAQKIPCEFHMFQPGGHGLSLSNWITNTVVEAPQQWIPLVHTWLEAWRQHE